MISLLDHLSAGVPLPHSEKFLMHPRGWRSGGLLYDNESYMGNQPVSGMTLVSALESDLDMKVNEHTFLYERFRPIWTMQFDTAEMHSVGIAKLCIKFDVIATAVYSNCSFRDLTIRGNLGSAVFIDCVFDSVWFHRVDFDRSVFDGCMFPNSHKVNCNGGPLL